MPLDCDAPVLPRHPGSRSDGGHKIHDLRRSAAASMRRAVATVLQHGLIEEGVSRAPRFDGPLVAGGNARPPDKILGRMPQRATPALVSLARSQNWTASDPPFQRRVADQKAQEIVALVRDPQEPALPTADSCRRPVFAEIADHGQSFLAKGGTVGCHARFTRTGSAQGQEDGTTPPSS